MQVAYPGRPERCRRSNLLTAYRHRHAMAAGRRDHLLAISVAHHAHASQRAGRLLSEDTPPPLPTECEWDDLQEPTDGTGTLFHRLYWTRIRETPFDAEQLMTRLQADPNRVCPNEFAVFQKLRGRATMRFGDEFVVRMAAPWDGPVRVVDVTPTSFRLATLDGHLEAGQIEFRARDEDALLYFQIESWARSADWLTDKLYAHLRMSKEVQLHMWTSVIERTARLAKGRSQVASTLTRAASPTPIRTCYRRLGGPGSLGGAA